MNFNHFVNSRQAQTKGQAERNASSRALKDMGRHIFLLYNVNDFAMKKKIIMLILEGEGLAKDIKYCVH